MDSFNEVINWDEDELAHLFRGMLLPLVARRKFPTFSHALNSWALNKNHNSFGRKVDSCNSWHLQHTLKFSEETTPISLGLSPWSTHCSSGCEAGQFPVTWGRKFMCGQRAVMEVLCFERRLVCFFRFNELKLNDCCYCCGKQRSADQLFRKLACVFCGCMHFISVPSAILLRLAVFCFSKIHIFPNLISAKFMMWHTSTWKFPMEINL